ncbi:MAG TPA: hypothetical protein VHQ41_01785 [Patescibacteria group bacterium]|jgi:hypothetical protein|nr:hypothetical protein [Patescibacteria group bacterium]
MKDFFKRIWARITAWPRSSKITAGIWGLCVVAFVAFLIIHHNIFENNKNNADQAPEVTQNYEPRIGEPLSTDVPSDTVAIGATVAGDSTTTPAAPEPAPQNYMVAPKTGVDPNEPIAYENSDLKFSATLPAGAKVNESQLNKVIFTTKQGSLLYIVSTSSADNETLQTLKAQLSNSSSASNITNTTFNNHPALKFTVQGYGAGIVFIANGKIYYLLGTEKYFADFKI